MYQINMTITASLNDTIEEMLKENQLSKPKKEVDAMIIGLIKNYIQDKVDNYEDEICEYVERQLKDDGYIK